MCPRRFFAAAAGVMMMTLACSPVPNGADANVDSGAWMPMHADGGVWMPIQPAWCGRAPCACTTCDPTTELCFVDFPSKSSTGCESENIDDVVYRCTPRAGARFPNAAHPFEDHCSGTPSCSCMRMSWTDGPDGDAGRPLPGDGPLLPGDDLLSCTDLPDGVVAIARMRGCVVGKGKHCEGLQCASGLTCFDNTCMTPGGIGDPCDNNVATCSEADGLHCDLTRGLCSGPGGNGAWCNPEHEQLYENGLLALHPSDCSKGLHCDDYRGICVPPGVEGAPCSWNHSTIQCGSSLHCDRETSVCAPPGGKGAACSVDSDCRSSLHCDDTGFCVAGGE